MRWATACQVYLDDMADYGTMNTVYSAFFDVAGTAPPTRLALAVDQLPVSGLVEIQCTGHCDNCDWATAHGLRTNSTKLRRGASSSPLPLSGTSAVTAWLRTIGLVQYASAFAKAGYDDMEVLRTGLTAAELREVGVNKPGHIKKLQMKLAALL
jgi:hypothetical protein